LYPPVIAGDLAWGQRKDAADTEEAPKGEEPKAEESLRKTPKKSDSVPNPIKKPKTSLSDVDTASVRSVKTADNETLSEKELKTAVRELQAFLADVRRRLQRFFDPDQTVRSLSEVQSAAQSEDI